MYTCIYVQYIDLLTRIIPDRPKKLLDFLLRLWYSMINSKRTQTKQGDRTMENKLKTTSRSRVFYNADNDIITDGRCAWKFGESVGRLANKKMNDLCVQEKSFIFRDNKLETDDLSAMPKMEYVWLINKFGQRVELQRSSRARIMCTTDREGYVIGAIWKRADDIDQVVHVNYSLFADKIMNELHFSDRKHKAFQIEGTRPIYIVATDDIDKATTDDLIAIIMPWRD